MSAQEQVTQLLDLLNAALADEADAFDLDEVPATRPQEYVEVSLSRMFGGQRRLCAGIGTTGYRFTVRAVSSSSVWNVRANLEKCRAALEFQRIATAEGTSTPVQFETEDPAGADDGWFSGLQSYTFVV